MINDQNRCPINVLNGQHTTFLSILLLNYFNRNHYTLLNVQKQKNTFSRLRDFDISAKYIKKNASLCYLFSHPIFTKMVVISKTSQLTILFKKEYYNKFNSNSKNAKIVTWVRKLETFFRWSPWSWMTFKNNIKIIKKEGKITANTKHILVFINYNTTREWINRHLA